MTTIVGNFPRAFAVEFKNLTRWDPISFEQVNWHWPEEYMVPIRSLLKNRKEKVDRSRFAFSDLQPITIHFDGSIDRRNMDGKKEYVMNLFFAHPGDIVVAKIDLKNGAVAIVPEGWTNVVVTGHFAVYEPERSKLLPEYFQRLIQTDFFRAHLWRNKVGAEGRKEVKLDFFESLLIPIPSLSIQRIIVNRWEEVQKKVAEDRAKLEHAENEISLLIYEVLGIPKQTSNGPTPKSMALRWQDLERWSFNYLVRTEQGVPGFSRSRYPIASLHQYLIDTMNGYSVKPVAGPTPYRMLKLNALTSAGLDLTKTKFVSIPDRLAEKFSLRKGDLLICRSVGSYEHIAKCTLVEKDDSTILFPDIIIRVRIANSLLPKYVQEVIQTPLGRSYFQSFARTSVGMWKISAADIRNFSIPIPPLEVQREIVKMVEERRTEIAKERERINDLTAAVKQEVEEMILGARPVPEMNGSRKLSV